MVLASAAHDIRYAVRTLRKSRGFTAAAVATLALAIGASTAMFSVVNAVLLRPLPYPAPEQLAMLWTEAPAQNLREGRSVYRNVEAWRRENKSFAGMAVFDPASVTLTGAAGAEQISVARVSPDFFSMLGVQPLHGRSLSAADAEHRQRVALISHAFWQRQYGGAPGAVGAPVELGGVRSRIVGILPPDFEFPRLNADVWEPHTLAPEAGSVWFVLGRLRPGVSVQQAQAEMNGIARGLDDQLPVAERNRGITVVPLSQQAVGPRSRLALWMLMAAVLLVLLIAAANAAGLALARNVGRTREIAVRCALGASAARILRQLLAESLTLAAFAGALGSLLALAAIHFIRTFNAGDVPRLNEVSLDSRVLAWALVLTLITGVLTGLAPALPLFRQNRRPSFDERGRGVAGGAAARGARRALVVAEFALAIVLLAGAGLLIRSWWNLENVDPGFRPERVLTAHVAAPADRVNFYNRVLERLQSVPGVESAAITSELFVGGSPEQVVTTEDGAAPQRLRLRSDEVSAGFFNAVGTPLLRGRFFSSENRPESPRVAIINEAMARRLWRGADPAGRRFKLGGAASPQPWFTVVGAVGNMRRQGPETEAIPQMFEPLAQNPPRLAILVVRTSATEPLNMAGTIRAAVHQIDKRVPVYRVTTLEDRLASFVVQRRFQTWLVSVFSAVALLMAAIGIYGLVRYSVATRTNEIGIRMAVGAQAGDIFRMVLGEGLRLSLIGLMLGLTGALWLGRAASSLLFGVGGSDPLTFAAVSALLIGVAAAACYFPARRAVRIEPVAALRQD